MDTRIPDIDPSIDAGEPDSIEGYHFGRVLGQGAFGKVVELRTEREAGVDGQSSASSGQVVKCISKMARNNIDGLKELKNQIISMECFSREDSKHPNITQLLGVYHSKSHVFLRIESGGPEDLGRRLLCRDSRSAPRLMSAEKVSAVISQCSSAIMHLHGQLSIAHRDVKPDNIVLSEDANKVCIKLTDFGLSKIVNGTALSRSVAGTLPYMSVEMVLENKSNVFCSDMWSLGIVFLDLLCFARFIERQIFRKQSHVKDRDSSAKKHRLISAVHDCCQKPGVIDQLLQTHLRQELHELRASSTVVLQGVLNVSPARRWTYKDLWRWVGSQKQSKTIEDIAEP